MSAWPKLSAAEYLMRERASATKSEFIAGEVFAMGGASPAHNLLAGNLIRELGNQLKKRPCRVYPGDLRIKVLDGYVYPDVTVVCGRSEFVEQDNLANPTLIVEVLSPSTADYDLGGKFARYRRLPSLQDYLLVAQDRVVVTHYHRQDEQHWLLSEIDDLAASVVLPGVDCVLELAEIYHKVFD